MTARQFRPGVRWVPVISVLLLASLAVVVVFAGLPFVGSSQATVSPTAPVPTPVGTDVQATAPVATGPADDAAWWRMRFDLMAMGDVQVIDVGTLGGGVVATVEVPMQVVDPDVLVFPMRSIIGPAGGLVVTISADGPESVLRSIDAASGEEREIVRTTHLVIDAQFAGGTSIVFLTADRATGQLTGSWLVDAVAPAEPRPVDGLLAAEPDIQLVARAAPSTRLIATPTGDVVAVLRCNPAAACGLRAVNLVDGTRYAQQIAAGDEPIGLAGELVFLRPMCMEMACVGELLDLTTGDRTPLPDAGNRLFFDEVVIDTEAGAVLVTQQSGNIMPMEGQAEAPSVVVTELGDRRSGPPLEIALRSMRIVPQAGHELGVELPTGWFTVMGTPIEPGAGASVPLEIFAISAADGRVVPLPVLGEFFIQG